VVRPGLSVVEGPSGHRLWRRRRRRSQAHHGVPLRCDRQTKCSPTTMNLVERSAVALFTKVWGKLEIGPAWWLSGDLVWWGSSMVLVRNLFGHW
jgi:hypothetical protein